MRVIRYGSGWDIAVDMVFTDRKTAETVAERIRHAVTALIRDAVDASMCRRTDAGHAVRETCHVTPRYNRGRSSAPQQQQER